MNSFVKRSIAAGLALGATALVALPASAMTVAPQQGANSLLQVSSWGDRVRGRTSSSTPALGYGYFYGDDYTYRRAPHHYGRPAYGYGQGYPNGYGYEDGAY